jgi:hypothetical protein
LWPGGDPVETNLVINILAGLIKTDARQSPIFTGVEQQTANIDIRVEPIHQRERSLITPGGAARPSSTPRKGHFKMKTVVMTLSALAP